MAIHPLPLLLLLLLKILSLRLTSAVDFVFNGFDSSNLLFYGNAVLESDILSLTNDSTFSMGRVLYSSKVQTKSPNSSNLLPFSTSFIFSIAPYKNYLPGHGLVFLFAPSTGIQDATPEQYFGLFNHKKNGDPNNHVFGIEFDVFANQEFNDISPNHVGVDVNSLVSIIAQPAGYWPDNDDGSFDEVTLNNGVNYQVWIDFFNSQLSVTMAPAGMKRPQKPLINVSLNLSEVLLDEMYVGFSAGTGQLVESHRILAWSFSNSNFSENQVLITSNLPSFVPRRSSVFRSKGFVAGITVATVFLICCGAAIYFLLKRKRRRGRETEVMEEWELEYWPHRITYQEIYAATKGFSEENVIGSGGNGKVYKGVMVGGVKVAVKRISQQSEQGMREFLAEVSSLGRLRHRNLVGLKGWCKGEKGSLILVYDFMENGSLDKRVFECEECVMLSWEDRVRVLKDVAAGVLYLHEGWDARVLHRDIKASNVLLDKDMNGRLGDFGLARINGHGQASSTTHVVGTVGYIAPELVQRGRASVQTDVFSFGVLILEVVCGRRPIENGKPPLVAWVWGLMEQGELESALDERLRVNDRFNYKEVERMLNLGLLCTYPDPQARLTSIQVTKLLEGTLDTDMLEGEGMKVCPLDKMKSMAMWPKYHHNIHHRMHPTFENIQQPVSSCVSLSGSFVIVEGR